MPCRAEIQRRLREKYAQFISEQLCAVLEGDRERVFATERLLPPGSMKRKCLRRLFGGWAKEFREKGRIFTINLAARVCALTRDALGLPMSSVEDVRMHSMLKTARKRAVEIPTMASAMDTCETCPTGEEEAAFFYFL